MRCFASITWNNVSELGSPVTSSKRIMPIAHCLLRLKPWIIRWLRANSIVAISSFFIVVLGMVFTIDHFSIKIQVTFYSHMYPIMNRGRLYGFDPNWRSLSVNVMVAQHVAQLWLSSSSLFCLLYFCGIKWWILEYLDQCSSCFLGWYVILAYKVRGEHTITVCILNKKIYVYPC